MTEKDFVKSAGKKIARQRKLAGLTQSAAAFKLKIEKESVSGLETGAIPPIRERISW